MVTESPSAGTRPPATAPGTTDRDPGLQAERTTIAWTRTALSCLVGGALLLLRYLDPHRSDRVGLVVAAFVLATLVSAGAWRRQRALRTRATAPACADTALVAVPALGIAALASVVTLDLAGLRQLWSGLH